MYYLILASILYVSLSSLWTTFWLFMAYDLVKSGSDYALDPFSFSPYKSEALGFLAVLPWVWPAYLFVRIGA